MIEKTEKIINWKLRFILIIGFLCLIIACETKEPENAEDYIKRGFACDLKFEFDQAIKDFTKALEMNPDLIEIYFYRGCSYMFKGNKENAIKDFEKYLELEPEGKFPRFAEIYIEDLKK